MNWNRLLAGLLLLVGAVAFLAGMADTSGSVEGWTSTLAGASLVGAVIGGWPN